MRQIRASRLTAYGDKRAVHGPALGRALWDVIPFCGAALSLLPPAHVPRSRPKTVRAHVPRLLICDGKVLLRAPQRGRSRGAPPRLIPAHPALAQTLSALPAGFVPPIVDTHMHLAGLHDFYTRAYPRLVRDARAGRVARVCGWRARGQVGRPAVLVRDGCVRALGRWLSALSAHRRASVSPASIYTRARANTA
jgi:hypothetical protein